MKTLETPWKCFVRACKEIRIDPIAASRCLTNLGVVQTGITDLTRQQVHTAQREQGHSHAAKIDCSFLTKPGEALALLDSAQAFAMSQKAAARISQCTELAHFCCIGSQLRSQGQACDFGSTVKALVSRGSLLSIITASPLESMQVSNEVSHAAISARTARARGAEIIRTVKTALEAAIAPLMTALEVRTSGRMKLYTPLYLVLKPASTQKMYATPCRLQLVMKWTGTSPHQQHTS